MPKINQSAQEHSIGSPIERAVNLVSGEISVSSTPVLICGVNRKINIGNFENIDIYAGITIPLNGLDASDKEAFSEAVKEAAAYGFGLVSKETGERYMLIKEGQQGK
jgi:hypothetical protein